MSAASNKTEGPSEKFWWFSPGLYLNQASRACHISFSGDLLSSGKSGSPEKEGRLGAKTGK